MMHYYFSDKAHIFWDDVIEAVVIRWNSLAQEEDFRVPLNKLIELAVIKKAKKALLDKSPSLVLAEDAKWLSEEWLPKLLNAGIQYTATVTPENTMANIDMRAAVGKDTTKLRYHDFEDIHNAVGWLSGISA
ncbi:hypothetical protein [Paenibacillus aceris]|uniref:STAS/SEC14 domain-containing protein n=1 Tax=Paenibacillus aceris TaxID=869555 RepID=A0ABS4HS81_9BACL|nr:hypothetical protein [Paenibacillus aceris]MBP1960879.1 hypothetical protein [Paenibacillus aceris]NHW35452.1 hypothetical protein [Paenibacillus aceris]